MGGQRKENTDTRNINNWAPGKEHGRTILPHQGENETAQPIILVANQKGKEAHETAKTNAARKEKTGKQQKQLEYDTDRKSRINMENGLRTLNIASLNPDSMREEKMQKEIEKACPETEYKLQQFKKRI